MNSEQLSKILASTVVDLYPLEFVERIRGATGGTPERWDAPVIELIRGSSPEQLQTLLTLIRWVSSEAVGTALGVIDPASGADQAGGVKLKDCETGEDLEFVQSLFLAECENRGLS